MVVALLGIGLIALFMKSNKDPEPAPRPINGAAFNPVVKQGKTAEQLDDEEIDGRDANAEYKWPTDEQLQARVTPESLKKALDKMKTEVRIPTEPAPKDPEWMYKRKAGEKLNAFEVEEYYHYKHD